MAENATISNPANWPATAADAEEHLRELLTDLRQLGDRQTAEAAHAVRLRYAEQDPVFVSHVADGVGMAISQAQQAADFLHAALTVWSGPAATRLPGGEEVASR
jgi:hypothetical protein